MNPDSHKPLAAQATPKGSPYCVSNPQNKPTSPEDNSTDAHCFNAEKVSERDGKDSDSAANNDLASDRKLAIIGAEDAVHIELKDQNSTEHKEAEESEDELDRIPPDFQLCKKHRRANYMRKAAAESLEHNLPEERCKCCSKVFKNSKYKLCDKTKSFGMHGFGISLYFTMVKHMLRILAFVFVGCLAVFLIYLNGGISEWKMFDLDFETWERIAGEDYDDVFFNKYSLGRLTEEELSSSMAIGVALLIVLFFFPWVQFNSRLRGDNIKLDTNNLTPADYTVMLQGVPAAGMTDEEMMREIDVVVNREIGASAAVPLKTLKVTPAYDLTNFTKLSKELEKIKKKKIIIENYRRRLKDQGVTEDLTGKYPKGFEKEDYQTIVNSYKEKKKEIERLTSPEEHTRLKLVFATFTHTASDALLSRYYLGMLKGCFLKPRLHIAGTPVTVLRAPEPEDVNWQNLVHTRFSRIPRIVLNWFLTLIILGACLAGTIFVSRLSEEYHEDSEEHDELPWLSVLFSGITMCINAILCFAIPNVTKLERLGSQTGYYCSVAIKLSVSLFLNNAVIPFITYTRSIYFTEGGFLMTVCTNWALICIVDPLTEVFDVWYLVAKLKWWLVKRKGSESTLTQREANVALEPCEVSMVTKYAELMNIMFYTSFYALLFPPGILITAVGLGLHYWVTKYLMITRYKVPKISGEIALNSMIFVGWMFPLLALVSTQVVIVRLKDDLKISYWLTLALPLILIAALFAIRHLLGYYKKSMSTTILYRIFVGNPKLSALFFNKFKDVPYDPFRFGMVDYKISNPVTKPEGIRELVNYCNANAKTEEQKAIAQKLYCNIQLLANSYTSLLPEKYGKSSATKVYENLVHGLFAAHCARPHEVQTPCSETKCRLNSAEPANSEHIPTLLQPVYQPNFVLRPQVNAPEALDKD